MAQPIALEIPPRDARKELITRLEKAPAEHAEALLDAFITLQKKIDAQSLTGEERPRHLNADAPSEFIVPKYGAHDLEPPKNVKLWNIIYKNAPKTPGAASENGSGKD